MSLSDRIHFTLMSLVHETLYGWFRDPHKALAAAGLRPGQVVLEVGCGPGFFTVPAARTVGDEGTVYALDISPLAIERVRQKVAQAGVHNVRTVRADAAQTGLADRSFDLIFVFGFGHPNGNIDAIMAELHRLLKPSGILAVERGLPVPNRLFTPIQRQAGISQFHKRGS